MKLKIKCEKCETNLVIIENSLSFPEEKNLEKALCPICNNEVYSDEIDGWYFIDTEHNLENANSEVCIYPMP